jgi:acetylornithine deacetylase
LTSPPPDAAAIDAAVEARRGDLIALVQRLVRVPSVTGEEGAVQQIVAEEMARLGLAVDVWEPSAGELAPYAEHVGAFETLAGRPNVVGTWKGSGEGRSLILNGHIDTVEPGDPSTWSSPAFDAAIVDGTIVGRGSLDMKGGVATHLIAVAALRDLGFSPGGDVYVESVISEEDGGAGALATILRGYRADGAIITEPTDLSVMTAHAGSLVFRVHIQGKSAHAAVRDEGVSAFEKFLPIFDGLNAFEVRRNAAIDHPLFAQFANKIPINIGVVRSGSWPSSVPEWLIAEGRAGLVPGEDLDTFKAELVEAVMQAAARDPWLAGHPPTVEWFSGQFAPAEIAADHPLARTVAAAHEQVTGSPATNSALTGGADMRHFILFGGTPCLMYGAGSVSLAHHADEAIVIDELITATKTIAASVVAWTGKSAT